jgi:pimeloyl-ACP methyl ester carboxylesterase
LAIGSRIAIVIGVNRTTGLAELTGAAPDAARFADWIENQGFETKRFGPVRRAINKIVAEKLTNEPTVVIGHSLGTVVAYDVLRQHAGNAVPRYVTVGSPLGIRAIRRRLEAPLTMPTGVEDWYNARDQRDVVALYPLDKTNFDITPAIRNFSRVDNHTDNRHGIAGYLDDVQVAKEIRNAMR